MDPTHWATALKFRPRFDFSVGPSGAAANHVPPKAVRRPWLIHGCATLAMLQAWPSPLEPLGIIMTAPFTTVGPHFDIWMDRAFKST